MTLKKLLLSACLLAGLSTQAFAGDDSTLPNGSTLVHYAKTDPMVAIAYVRGFIEGWHGRVIVQSIVFREKGIKPEVFNDKMNDSGIMFCIPQSVSPSDTLDIVLKHLAAYPGDEKLAMDAVVYAALANAFPCKSTLKPV